MFVRFSVNENVLQTHYVETLTKVNVHNDWYYPSNHDTYSSEHAMSFSQDMPFMKMEKTRELTKKADEGVVNINVIHDC